MNDEMGIAIAEENKSMRDGEWQWDSRKVKLTVDTQQDPPHLKIIEMDGGTKWAMTAGQDREEILYEIEHKMPFKPKFLAYFYYLDVPTGFSLAIGKYDNQQADIVVNAFGYGTEYLIAEVTDKFFRIKHTAHADTTLTAHGSDFKFRIKYEIMNVKALYTGPS